MSAAEQAAAGSGLVRRMLTWQATLGVAAYAVAALLVPWALLIEKRLHTPVLLAGLEVALAGIVVTAVLSARHLSRNRDALAALVLETESIKPKHVGRLADLPSALTWRFVGATGLSPGLLLLPGVRPARLDDARAVSLFFMMFTIIAAAAVVHYVVIRQATIKVIMLIPPDLITTWLEDEAVGHGLEQRVTRRILLAVVAPVALVGVGAVLVTHAHLQAAMERSRAATARLLVRTALEPSPSQPREAGRDDAITAAAVHGFIAHIERGQDGIAQDGIIQRLPGGQMQIIVPLDDGRAVVRYQAKLKTGVVTASALIALLAVALAAALGSIFGRVVSADLLLATQHVSLLGSKQVLEGTTLPQGRARFRVVADLGRAVEALADRFRVFAEAHKQALRAKESAKRMKELLFASVSHDLKSPLNAILGFADLIAEEPLTNAQRESLEMVSGRGRELLGLIETILDAARVDAGQLRIIPGPVSLEEVLNDALSKAVDLQSDSDVDIIVEMAPHLPPLEVDRTYVSRALAVLIAHAVQSAEAEPGRGEIVIRTGMAVAGTHPHKGIVEGMIHLHVEYAGNTSRPSQLEALLQRRTVASRGMALQLGLARSIIELHRGQVKVERGPHGGAIVTCSLPIASA